ncbi:MAG: FHA domain-containing protein, partial [Myxococcota bacterium]
MGESHYVLEILSATGESSSRTLQPEGVIIGRRKGEIIIDDAGASGRHAELQLQGDAVEVRDLGSTNGIVWGGSIVRDPFQVAVGETFQIGRTKFTVKAIHHPEPAPVAEPEVEEGDDEEATAFISAADLGMEDLSPEPVVQAPEPVVQAPEPVVQAPEPV